MPINVKLHQLDDLSHKESTNEIFLKTTPNTELHIVIQDDDITVITFPFGNKFDLIDGKIIIHNK